MSSSKKIVITVIVILFFAFLANSGKAQIFWLGFKGGPSHIWFTSPKFNNMLASNGYGWNLGAFIKYGRRPYYQLGFHWTRAQVNMKLQFEDILIAEDKVPFHNFDVPVKMGYELIYTAKFKWYVEAGPFIGTTFVFSSTVFEFDRDDFRNPQFGVLGGTGIQFYNFIVEIDYSYHITELFKADDELGYDLGAHLQILALKVGMQF